MQMNAARYEKEGVDKRRERDYNPGRRNGAHQRRDREVCFRLRKAKCEMLQMERT